MPRKVDTATDLKFQVCTKLVMDTTDPDITFGEDSVCNYWAE